MACLFLLFVANEPVYLTCSSKRDSLLLIFNFRLPVPLDLYSVTHGSLSQRLKYSRNAFGLFDQDITRRKHSLVNGGSGISLHVADQVHPV